MRIWLHFVSQFAKIKAMRKRIHQKMEELGGVTESQATMEQKVTVDQWNDPKFLSQEINKELYDLNVTNEEIKVSLQKIQTYLLWGLAIIALLLFCIVLR